jgi:hypothetical protein
MRGSGRSVTARKCRVTYFVSPGIGLCLSLPFRDNTFVDLGWAGVEVCEVADVPVPRPRSKRREKPESKRNWLQSQPLARPNRVVPGLSAAVIGQSQIRKKKQTIFSPRFRHLLGQPPSRKPMGNVDVPLS